MCDHDGIYDTNGEYASIHPASEALLSDAALQAHRTPEASEDPEGFDHAMLKSNQASGEAAGADVALPSQEDIKKMQYIIESLIGGLSYDGIKKWLAMYSTLEEAYQAAQQLRSGMIAG